jgi:hypothetical protein
VRMYPLFFLCFNLSLSLFSKSQALGPYIDGLKKLTVDSHLGITKLLNDGGKVCVSSICLFQIQFFSDDLFVLECVYSFVIGSRKWSAMVRFEIGRLTFHFFLSFFLSYFDTQGSNDCCHIYEREKQSLSRRYVDLNMNCWVCEREREWISLYECWLSLPCDFFAFHMHVSF